MSEFVTFNGHEFQIYSIYDYCWLYFEYILYQYLLGLQWYYDLVIVQDLPEWINNSYSWNKQDDKQAER